VSEAEPCGAFELYYDAQSPSSLDNM